MPVVGLDEHPCAAFIRTLFCLIRTLPTQYSFLVPLLSKPLERQLLSNWTAGSFAPLKASPLRALGPSLASLPFHGSH